MNIRLRPDQETPLAQLATRTGGPADQLAQDAIDALLEHDLDTLKEWLRVLPNSTAAKP